MASKSKTTNIFVCDSLPIRLRPGSAVVPAHVSGSTA